MSSSPRNFGLGGPHSHHRPHGNTPAPAACQLPRALAQGVPHIWLISSLSPSEAWRSHLENSIYSNPRALGSQAEKGRREWRREELREGGRMSSALRTAPDCACTPWRKEGWANTKVTSITEHPVCAKPCGQYLYNPVWQALLLFPLYR